MWGCEKVSKMWVSSPCPLKLCDFQPPKTRFFCLCTVYFFTKRGNISAKGSSRWHGSCWAQSNTLHRVCGKYSHAFWKKNSDEARGIQSEHTRLPKNEGYSTFGWNWKTFMSSCYSGTQSWKLSVKLESCNCRFFISNNGLKQKLTVVVKPQQQMSMSQ